MLYLKEFIGHGAVRDCYLHPDDPGKCVKVIRDPKDLHILEREIMLTQLLSPLFGELCATCEPDVVETDRGMGMVSNLIVDADGSTSPSLHNFLHAGGDAHELQPTLDAITRTMIENDLFFYDFNGNNFVIQTLADGSRRAVFIDLKSLHRNGYWGYLKLERWIAPLGRNIMYRRIRRLYSWLGLEFPFDDLCREMYFKGFFVRFRPSLHRWKKKRQTGPRD